MCNIDLVPTTRILISVSDKTGLINFLQKLKIKNLEIISTGGTAESIANAGFEVTPISNVTGFPEILDGRVKTLHPKVHGALLARRDLDSHLDEIRAQNIKSIDLLIVNLYPFEKMIESTDDPSTLIEHIDIGGPAMLRAAAKNHEFLTVVCDPEDYDQVADMIAVNGGTDLKLRKTLAAKCFSRTAAYDSAISRWMAKNVGDHMPKITSIAGYKSLELLYGENPHQKAALYQVSSNRPGVVSAKQLQGKPLTYNNINDTDAAFELVSEFRRPTIAIIKHSNPCGVATSENLVDAWQNAFQADPKSAFGGIVAINREINPALALEMSKLFLEVVIAPKISDEALDILAKKQNLRLLLTGSMPDPKQESRRIKSVAGGFLLQSRDTKSIKKDNLEVVTKLSPKPDEIRDMLFAWKVAKYVKSNAVVLAKDNGTVGIGAGQMSRVDAVNLSIMKANSNARENSWKTSKIIGSVAASDAFFPFADGLQSLVEAGVTSVIQPGGSLKDKEVIASANEAGIAMVFSGFRHFNH